MNKVITSGQPTTGTDVWWIDSSLLLIRSVCKEQAISLFGANRLKSFAMVRGADARDGTPRTLRPEGPRNKWHTEQDRVSLSRERETSDCPDLLGMLGVVPRGQFCTVSSATSSWGLAP